MRILNDPVIKKCLAVDRSPSLSMKYKWLQESTNEQIDIKKFLK